MSVRRRPKQRSICTLLRDGCPSLRDSSRNLGVTLCYGSLKPRARTSSSTNLVGLGGIRLWNTAPGIGRRHTVRRSTDPGISLGEDRGEPRHRVSTTPRGSRSGCSLKMMSCQKPTCLRMNPGTNCSHPPPHSISEHPTAYDVGDPGRGH